MCGIAGYCGSGSREKLELMLNEISHRGPDDSGAEIIGKVGLGNNRLAIIDLSPLGHQPMFNDDKTLAIVFNGEIYNFHAIREELVKEFSFKSRSDTEVLLYAYQKWGVDCLKKLNGMFSFVIYDIKNDLLFGARDRLGEKPFKYYYDGKDFVFASEIKAILKFLDTSPEIDPEAINQYMTKMYVPAPRTGFKGIYKLPPAHYLILKNGDLTINRYWSLDFSEKLNLNENEWMDLILSELDRSVKMRLVSDVPVGALLSGGVDSSAVVAFMAKNSSHPVKTFSIGFDDKSFDETQYAEIVSRKYSTEHTVLSMDAESMIGSLDGIARLYDEPFADNSILPTYLVSKMTREHVTVALNGDGGDENFAGYDRYNLLQFLEYYQRLPHLLRKRIVEPISRSFSGKFESYNTKLITHLLEHSADEFFTRYEAYNFSFAPSIKNKIYSSEFKTGLVDSHDSVFFNTAHNKLSDFDKALEYDINTYLPENLLFKTDIASMACSLELRAPLLDPIFMENIAKMPFRFKLRNGEKKYIFKKALVERNILPAEIVYRRKQGFNIPQRRWFKGALKDGIRDSILSDSMLGSGIFDKTSLSSFLDEYFSTNNVSEKNIFSLYMLARWLGTYAKR